MKKTNMIVLLLFIGYTALLCYWMFWGFGRSAGGEYRYNLQPFLTIRHYFVTDRLLSSLINLLGNIAVFVPFGILIPRLLGGKMVTSYCIFILGVFLLEMTQLVSRRGSFDIDDLLLNSVGFLIGWGCALSLAKCRRNVGKNTS